MSLTLEVIETAVAAILRDAYVVSVIGDGGSVEELASSIHQLPKDNPLVPIINFLQSSRMIVREQIPSLIAKCVAKLGFNPIGYTIKKIKDQEVFAVVIENAGENIIHKFDMNTSIVVYSAQTLHAFLQLVANNNTITFDPNSAVEDIDNKKIDEKEQREYIDNIYNAFDCVSTFVTE
jgi:hypothetical protein